MTRKIKKYDNSNKRALITGITGQDGAYLAKFLIEKNYKVFGTYRRISTPNFWRLQALDIKDKITIIPLELSDSSSIICTEVSQPREIYNLAAQSFVESSFDNPIYTTDVSGVGVLRLLEVLRHHCPEARLYQASTSEMYGDMIRRTLRRFTIWSIKPLCCCNFSHNNKHRES